MLFLTVIFFTLSNAVTTRRDKSILYARVAISIFICSIIICLNSLNIQFINNGIGLFGGLYQTTVINNSFQIFMFILTALILQLNAFYPRKVVVESFSIVKQFFNKFSYFNQLVINKMSGQFKIIEYPLILIFVIIGAVLLTSSSDLVSLFLSIELQSYALYILCTVYRNSERSVSGGLTYFLLGGLSSCFILLGSSLLYGNSGNTAFESIYIINNISLAYSADINWFDSYYISLSLIILSVGFLFKVSAAPFHFWSPDVYDAIPTIVTSFVAIMAKISIFVLLLELVHFTTNYYSNSNFSWTITLIVSSMLSLIIGAVMGLTQFRIKRLFAYSTISHLGFILLALTINTVESVQSFIFYLMQYSVSNLNAFLLLITIGFSLYCFIETHDKSHNTNNIIDNIVDKSTDQYKKHDVNKIMTLNNNSSLLSEELQDTGNSPIQLISQLKGYFNINPYIALSLTITLFSFVGIPPLIGFFAKQMVLSAALDNGYVFITFVAILTSVISAYYYLAVVKQMFFHKTNYIINPSLNNWTVTGALKNSNNITLEKVSIGINNIKLSSAITVTISILTLIMLLFMLIPNEWLNLANILALILFENL